MEQEKLAAEAEEKAKAEKEKNLKEGFSLSESSDQWEKDKQAASDLAKQEREASEASEADTAPKPEKTGKPAADEVVGVAHDAELPKKKTENTHQGVGA